MTTPPQPSPWASDGYVDRAEALKGTPVPSLQPQYPKR
jgi:hypothetical protein